MYTTINERVRGAPLLALDEPRFPLPLIAGGRFGGQLLIATMTFDPLMPDTLDVYFDQWNLAARASLLLQYARLVTESNQPRAYIGIADQLRRQQQIR